MWQKITEIAKTAAAMLHAGDVPPNTPERYKEDLSKVNFLASKKFFIVFMSLLMLVVYFAGSVFVLFLTAPFPNLTVPFVTMYVEAIKILAIIIGVFLSAQTIVDVKMSSNNSVNLNQNTESVTIKEEKRIVREGNGNAPTIKPFGVIATDE